MGRRSRIDALREQLLKPPDDKPMYHQSQGTPEEKLSTAEFQSLVVVTSPSASQVEQRLVAGLKRKGTVQDMHYKRSAKRARSSTVERRRRKIIEECKKEERKEIDVSTWSHKRSRSMSDFDIDVDISNMRWVHDHDHHTESSSRSSSTGRNNLQGACSALPSPSSSHPKLQENITRKGRDDSADLFPDYEHDTADGLLQHSHHEHSATDSPNYEKPDSKDDPTITATDVEELHYNLSQLSTLDTGECEEDVDNVTVIHDTDQIPDKDTHVNNTDCFQLPKLRKAFPVGKKAIRKRITYLRKYLRKLVHGGSPEGSKDEDDVGTLQFELQLAKGLVTKISRDLKKKTKSSCPTPQGRPQDIDLDASTATFVTSIPIGNRMRTANKILKSCGYQGFSSDRAIIMRLKQNVEWMKWSTTTKAIKGEQVIVTQVSNLKESLSEYVNRTYETIDMTNEDPRRCLVIRLGLDRGAGSTKVAVSVGNRRRLSNSPFNWLIVGTYNAKDDASTLRETVKDLFEAFDEVTLEDLELRPELKEQFDSLGKLLLGDLPAVNAVMGLKGHASRHPCYLCTTTKDQLHLKGAPRCYDNAEEKAINGEESHAYPPLLRNVTPAIPILHVFLGPVSTLFNKLEEDVKKAIIGERKSLPKTEWFREDIKVRNLRDVDAEARVLSECAKTINLLSKTRHSGAWHVDDCGVWCQQRKKRGSLLWTKCACGLWYHSICVGRLPSRAAMQLLIECASDCEEGMLGEQELKECPACGVVEQTVTQVMTCIKTAQSALAEERSNIVMVCASDNTPVYYAWENACRTHNVLKGQHHGGCLNGNQGRRFLKKAPEFLGILDLIKGAKDRVMEYVAVIKPLKRLHDLTRATYLSEKQLQSIPIHQEALRDAVLSTPWLNFTPKFHLLCSHLEEMARQYHTVGLHTEQGLEHLHKTYANEQSNFLQKKKLQRAEATATRINGCNMERLTNRHCQEHYRFLENGPHDIQEGKEEREDEDEFNFDDEIDADYGSDNEEEESSASEDEKEESDEEEEQEESDEDAIVVD